MEVWLQCCHRQYHTEVRWPWWSLRGRGSASQPPWGGMWQMCSCSEENQGPDGRQLKGREGVREIITCHFTCSTTEELTRPCCSRGHTALPVCSQFHPGAVRPGRMGRGRTSSSCEWPLTHTVQGGGDHHLAATPPHAQPMEDGCAGNAWLVHDREQGRGGGGGP